MRVVRAGAVLSHWVFGVGFVLGTLRAIWVALRIAAGMTELTETFILLLAAIVAARWIPLRLPVSPILCSGQKNLGIGGCR